MVLVDTNVIAPLYVRSARTEAVEELFARDAVAAFLQPQLFRVSHQAALEAALDYRVTAYDARFLALADQLGSRLVTEDARLRAAAPALTQSLAEALATR